MITLFCTFRLRQKLGSGQFGDVYCGIYDKDGDEVEVAVKQLKNESNEENRIKFLQEAAIMSQFKHPNIVSMYGVVTNNESVSAIEFYISLK